MTAAALTSRFVLEREIAVGGMGRVFRGRDVTTGEPVAVKTMLSGSAAEKERFLREAEALADVDHPAVVRHIAHGVAHSGDAYLVMEWLEGRDLGSRLEQGPLTYPETLALARRLAAALAAVHRRGIVHRDIKPRNVVLVDGKAEEARLIDFGVARSNAHPRRMTRTGVVIGTPCYMAPEQTRAQGDVDARVDLFAVGALLYECLTGAPPFEGPSVLEVLARILLEPTPPLGPRTKGVPSWFVELVERLLSKDPVDRPRDGEALLGELEATAEDRRARAEDRAPVLPSVTAGERRLLCVLLMGQAAPDPLGDTLTASEGADVASRVASIVEGHGAKVERLLHGAALVVIDGPEVASDLASRAARVARAVRAAQPGLPVVVASGRSEPSHAHVGEVARRGARMLEASGEREILVDPLTASLLERSWSLAPRGDDAFVLGEPLGGAQALRLVLGKAPPFVGRDKEIAGLGALFAEVVANREATLAIVTGAAGSGKSRLRSELVRALGDRSDSTPRILEACAEVDGQSSAFGLLSRAVVRAAGLELGEAPASRRHKLATTLGRELQGAPLAWAAEFLGELVAAPVEGPGSVALVAARQDPRIMGDGIRRAFVDWIAAFCRAGPCVLVLDDLHWADLPTVELLRHVVRALRAEPLLVLAFGRPELLDHFPSLASSPSVHHVRLTALSQRASQRMAAALLGEGAAEATLAFVAERAEGNPLYVEELAREIARRGDSAGPLGGLDVPDSVLGMMQARLDDLGPLQKRVLRAASVFGETFWRGGLCALLEELSAGDVDRALQELEQREIVDTARTSRFRNEPQAAFRHALIRDAAYATLLERDRAEAHGRAAAWLLGAGEGDAAILAHHFGNGPEPARALPFLVRAAKQALDGDDLRGAIARVERAVALGAAGEDRGSALLFEAQARALLGETEIALCRAEEASTLLLRGRAPWLRAVSETIAAAARLGSVDRVLSGCETLLLVRPEADALDAHVVALCRTMVPLTNMGRLDRAGAVLAALERIAPGAEGLGVYAAAQLHEARGVFGAIGGELGTFVEGLSAAVTAYEEAGALRDVANALASLAWGLLQVGAVEEAVDRLEQCKAVLARVSAVHLASWMAQQEALAAGLGGRLDAAVSGLRLVADQYARQQSRRQEGMARSQLARMLLRAGAIDDAETEARKACAVLEHATALLPLAQALLARALCASGRAPEALDLARRATSMTRSVGSRLDEPTVDLALVEALQAAGDAAGSNAHHRDATERLLDRASRLPPALAERFLGLPEHVLLLAPRA